MRTQIITAAVLMFVAIGVVGAAPQSQPNAQARPLFVPLHEVYTVPCEDSATFARFHYWSLPGETTYTVRFRAIGSGRVEFGGQGVVTSIDISAPNTWQAYTIAHADKRQIEHDFSLAGFSDTCAPGRTLQVYAVNVFVAP